MLLADRELGKTPCQVWLPPAGPAVITLMREGYLPEPFLIEESTSLSVSLRPGQLDLESAVLAPGSHPDFYPPGRGPLAGRDPSNWESLGAGLKFRVPSGFRQTRRETGVLDLAAEGISARVSVAPHDLFSEDLAPVDSDWSVTARESGPDRGWVRSELGRRRHLHAFRRVAWNGQTWCYRLDVRTDGSGTDLIRAYDLVRNNLEPRL